ncbi:hypothetical protein, conserved [Eimeria maxima]|uniref:Uncharacterized protein n=1 Tax=Eimeria maxima TaxID=5804 RepID=U6M9M7_EIMMA|nr:hypothetical protein, conserved [Eimeria maxima]CDJ59748.1 hypothetical protein, conserved [Eimeria maxima]
MGLGVCERGCVQSKTCQSYSPEGGEETEGTSRDPIDTLHRSLDSSAQLTQQQQQQQQQQEQLSVTTQVDLSQKGVEDIAELCMQVILKHEAEVTNSFPSALLKSVINANYVATSASGCHVNHLLANGSHADPEDGTESHLSPPCSESAPIAACGEFAPAFIEPLQASSAASNDEAPQDPSVTEQDLDIYTMRTITVLLLAGPYPVRVDDVRRCWMALPVQLRKRNFTALVLGRTAAIAASCFGLQLLSFQVKGDEEIRGFLLFLSLQFVSFQAELPLETVKASIRLVGRQDLLQGFDEASLLKAVHFREPSHKLESLGDFLSECECLKYIMIMRRPSAASEGAGETLCIVPTDRLLQELKLDSFRSECKATFGVELPDTRMHTTDREEVDGGAANPGT